MRPRRALASRLAIFSLLTAIGCAGAPGGAPDGAPGADGATAADARADVGRGDGLAPPDAGDAGRPRDGAGPADTVGAVEIAGGDAADTGPAAGEDAAPDAAGRDAGGPDAADAAGPPCTLPEQCPAGLGCVDGACGPCTRAEECRASQREGCATGVCGPCAAAGECAAGSACRAVVGECDTCRVAAECRPGEGCAEGGCGACEDALSCDGGLCRLGLCQPCGGPADDAECGVQYGDPDFTCGEDGACAPPRCVSGLDCWLLKRVCSAEGRCVPCADTAACVAEGSGGYAGGTVCVDGACAEADCTDSSDCPEDRPICGSDARCRACQSAAECAERAGAPSGWVCAVETGRCWPGDCYPAGAACGAAAVRICGGDFTCRDCEADGECRAVLAADAAICEGGGCVLGCADAGGCADGFVCAPDHRCGGCGSDAECAAAYSTAYLCLEQRCAAAECRTAADCDGGQRLCVDHHCVACATHAECGVGRVCAAGACLPGDCEPPGAVCGPGADRVCGADRLCGDCGGDPECAAALDNPAAICDGERCLVGCTAPSFDATGRVCGADHRFGDCAADAECVAATGNDAGICEAGRCAGGCTAPAVDAQGRVCGADRRYRDCAADAECVAATGDDAAICEAGRCAGGCTAPAMDAQGRVCGADHRFHDCGADADCVVATGNDAAICETGRCAGGCTPPAVDAQGRICGADHRFHDCGADAECVAATGHDAAICEAGGCRTGCTTALDCPAGAICAGDRRCGACGSNADCSTAYSAAYLCIEGQCLEAQCNAERACLLGRVCDPVLYACRDCQSHAECGPDRVCDLPALGGNGRCYPGACTARTQEALCASGLCADYACVACDEEHPCGPSNTGEGRVCSEGLCVVGECTAVTEERDCPSNLCRALHCVDCESLGACGAGRICDVPSGTCLNGDCVTSAHCGITEGTGAGQVCDGLSFECRDCTSDPDCVAAGYGGSPVCEDGRCQPGCASDGACLTNWCAAGRCRACEADADCQDGRVAVCEEVSGRCVPGTCATAADCPPSQNPCQQAACLDVNGTFQCRFESLPDSAGCDDHDLCTAESACREGTCEGVRPTCDDGVGCTTDACNPADGSCSITIEPGACLIGETCYLEGDAEPGRPCRECRPGWSQVGWSDDDTNRCHDHDDECNVSFCLAGECRPEAAHDGDPCPDDGVGCTADTCHSGACEHAAVPGRCDDGDSCTEDVCDPLAGCLPPEVKPDGAVCDDGLPTTDGDFCFEGACWSAWQQTVLADHTLTVEGVAWSPDGTLLASGSDDERVLVRSVSDGSVWRTLTGHTDPVYSVAFGPDGDTLVSGSWDFSVKVWDVSTGALVRTIPGPYGAIIHPVALSPDGALLAVGTAYPSAGVRIYRLADGLELRSLSGWSWDVTGIAFSPDGQRVAASGCTSYNLFLNRCDGGLVRVWSTATWAEVWSRPEHSNWARSVAFSPDGGGLAVGYDDWTVRTFQTADWALVHTLDGPTGALWSLAYSPDGSLLASGAGRADNAVWLWRVADGRLIRVLSGHTLDVMSIAFSPDGRLLASGGQDARVRVWGLSGFPVWDFECTADADCPAAEFCNRHLHRCVASACRDGADNDGDGRTDAADPDCAGGELEFGGP